MRFAVLALAFALPTVASAQDVSGTWLTESGTSRVRIAPCGAARCGTIVWSQGDAKDANNPDASQRGRPLAGVRMISNAVASGDSWSGQLYNPLDGKTYAGKMKLKNATQLELSGCVFGGLICRSQTWTRVN